MKRVEETRQSKQGGAAGVEGGGAEDGGTMSGVVVGEVGMLNCRDVRDISRGLSPLPTRGRRSLVL